MKKTSFLRLFGLFPTVLTCFLIALSVIFYLIINEVHTLSVKSLKDNEIKHYKQTVKNIKISLDTRLNNFINEKIAKEKELLKTRVQDFYKVASSVYFDMKKKGYENSDIETMIKNMLRHVKFRNGEEYFYILNLNGVLELNSAFPELEGKNCLNIKDIEGKYFIKDSIKKSLRKGEGWTKYHWKSADRKKIVEKLTYFKIFRPYNWIIGLTFNMESFLKEMKKEILYNMKNFRTSEFVGLMIINENNKMCYESSGIENITFNKILNSPDFIYEKFEIKQLQWSILVFSKKSMFLNIVESAEKIFSTKFKEKSMLFIPVILLFMLGFILYIYKNSSKLSFELKKLQESIKSFDTDKKNFSIKEFDEIANVFADVFKQLQKEKEFSKKVIDKINIGFIAMDTDFRIVFLNREAEKILGYGFKDICKKNFLQIIKPYINTKKETLVDMKYFINLINKKTVKNIYFHNKFGKSFPTVLLINKIELSNGVTNYIVAFRDITDGVKQEEEIKRLTDVVKNAPFPILITDANRRIIYANPFLLNHSQYSLDELYGNSPKIFQTEYNLKFYPELKKKITKGETWEGVFLNKKKDGTEFWEHIYIVPIKNEKGEIINFVGFKKDITERKAIEESLIEAKVKAQEGMRAKSEFLANMSHEIRTPINGIVGFVDLLLEKESDEDKKRYLEIIKDSTDSLLNVINDILDISKLESKKMVFEVLNFNIKDLIKECINTFKLKASEKNIQLKYYIDSDIPDYLKGDRLRLLQVLNNLVSNAVKFTEKGSITVKAESINKTSDTVEIKFTVADTGIGIKREKLDKIFESFAQAESSITRKYGGTGLGLTICKEIIANLNGKLQVESELGKGTKFFFTLTFPIGDEISISFDGIDKDSINLSNLKVLIAEDDVFNQAFFREIFNTLSIDTDIVENGYKLLEKLKEKRYDIIFTDLNMPVMDGFTAVEIIRKLEKGEKAENVDIDGLDEKLVSCKNIIIAFTASVDGELKSKLKEKGFDDYLSKPFKPKELTNILKKYSQNSEDISLDKIINLKELDELLGNDEGLRKQLINVFLENCKDIIKEFEDAIENNRFEELPEIAHKLKGAAGNIKADAIFQLSIEMEKCAQEENFERFLKLFKEMKNIVENIKI